MIYFSFDYSGIILFAKDIGFKEYLECIFELNYNGDGKKKLIRDSYSLYGFDKPQLREILKDYNNKERNFRFFQGNETFSVSVNIGIQNYNTYNDFIMDIKKIEPNIQEYGLFGRHDVSIVNEKANLEWLVYVQGLLDKYSTENWENNKGINKKEVFSTHETFVKIPDIRAFKDVKPEDEDRTFEKAEHKLEELCNRYFECLEKRENELNGEYRIPIQAVRYSTLSILKNRFAEDFVLCMYKPFCEFLEYLTEKVSAADLSARDFDACFSKFFRSLNALVNSVMHSERQFIQATAFNAIIYDVTSKIMAFYAAVIDDIQRIIRSDEDRRYTFFLTPSFQNEITVEIISYEEDPPHDRILKVSINEQSLYNPGAVVRRMTHEIAHFVGDALRKRDERKKRILESMVQFALTRILYKSFFEISDFYDLIDGIVEVLQREQRFKDDEENHSVSLFELRNVIAEEFDKNDVITDLIEKFVRNSLRECLPNKDGILKYPELEEELKKYIGLIADQEMGSSQNIIHSLLEHELFFQMDMEIFTNVIMQDIKKEILFLNRDEKELLENGEIITTVVSVTKNEPERVYLGQYIKILLSSCSEAFSDIQMVLVMNMGYDEYLIRFVEEENLDVDCLQSVPEDLIRFTVVAMTLHCIGFWSGSEQDKLEKKDEQIIKFDNIIKKYMRDIIRHISEEEFLHLTENQNLGREFRGDDSIQDDILKYISGPSAENSQYFYVNLKLTYYLLECTRVSLEQYKDEKKQNVVKQLRDTIRVVTECKDITKVFSHICAENKKYKDTLFL